MASEVQQVGAARSAVAADQTALTLALAGCHQRIRSIVGRRIPADLQPFMDADDVLQEAYFDVFRRIGSFEDRGAGSFERWVGTIALNRLRKAIKKHRSARRVEELPVERKTDGLSTARTVALLDAIAGSSWTASRFAAQHEAVEFVQAAISHLPGQYLRAIRLVYIAGRTAAEAAEEMGCTERAVHGLCRRGLRLLREELVSASRFFASHRCS